MFITQRKTRGREFNGQIFEESGVFRVRDDRARKRVGYRCSGYGCAWIIHQMMEVQVLHTIYCFLPFSFFYYLLL